MTKNLLQWPTVQGVTQLIQSAERLIAVNNYQLALDQLSVAQNLDPRNEYIKAIIDRVQSLQKSFTSRQPDPALLQTDLSVGSFDLQSEYTLSPKALEIRIKQLTNIAEKHLDEGAPDKAFDSLMKAFLLDPASPFVAACEKSVLPAWEKVRGTNHASSIKQGDYRPQEKKVPIAGNVSKPAAPTPELPQANPEQEHRLNKLREQKEAERQEKERSRWREASGPPKVLGTKELKEALTNSSDTLPSLEERGLFAKLRRGRFLK